jgi:hypothetical protein
MLWIWISADLIDPAAVPIAFPLGGAGFLIAALFRAWQIERRHRSISSADCRQALADKEAERAVLIVQHHEDKQNAVADRDATIKYLRERVGELLAELDVLRNEGSP